MVKIIGNTTTTPYPRPDWNQSDATKADYIKNKPTIPSIEGLVDEQYVKEQITTVAAQIGNKVDKVEGKGLSTNDLTDELLAKLDGIEEGASGNVQADWKQTDETQADFIKNKPEVLTEENVLDLIEEYGGDTQVQSDWSQTDDTQADYIKNKPETGHIVKASLDNKELILERVETIYGNGLGAYETALENGFEGTEEEWLLSLKGENGTDGRGIERMAYYDTSETGEVGIYVWYTDGTTEIIWIPGLKGEDGVGIESVESIPFGDEHSNLRIKLTDGRETEFSIYNGKTPIKGTDYWTEEDKAEIKSYVDEAILGGSW